MKLVKMSLAAAVLLGASAFAIDNIKVSGDAKLYYGTNNMGSQNLFSKGNEVAALTTGAGSFADTALRIGATGDLAKGISFGVTGYAVSTLGLENNLVSNTWTGAHGITAGNGSSFAEVAGGVGVNDASWLGEAWMAATLGKTTAKLGRMSLDTPLAFSETWSVVPNTFEGAVLLNQDIPDTTLVGAWVGKGNGGSARYGLDTATGAVGTAYTAAQLTANPALANILVGADGGVVAPQGAFSTFVNGGAYAAAVVNNSFKPLTAQAWYYNVINIADAYWLQGDIDCQLLKGVKFGAQYADMSPKGLLVGAKDSKAYAFKLGYEGVENLKVSAAYSAADKDGVLKVANVATGNGQSKLYTEAYWNYGYVGAAGADAVNVTAEYKLGSVELGAYVTSVSTKPVGATTASKLNEAALAASTAVGPLNATLAYVSTDADSTGVNGGKRFDTILAMLKLNF